eukprot:12387713-Prorocentrum_lima.AAC.1
MTRRMQWDVIHLIEFTVEAIIDEHRLIETGDVLITLHMPADAPEERRNETWNHFAEVLAEKGEI